MINDYVSNYKGQVALVCGSAPCLLEEYNKAKEQHPDAKVIAINEAVSGVYADFIVSYHVEKFNEFKSLSLNPNVECHTGKGFRSEKEDELIDVRWDDIQIGATSAGDAIQIAKKMGFSEIIMCGCPMNGGDGYFNKTGGGGCCPRFGAPKTMFGDSKQMVENHKRKLQHLKDTIDLSMVKSMSGFSAEVFGKPNWRE